MKSIPMIPMMNLTIAVSPNIGTGTMRITGRLEIQGKIPKAHPLGTIHLGTIPEARNLGKRAITTTEIPRRVFVFVNSNTMVTALGRPKHTLPTPHIASARDHLGITFSLKRGGIGMDRILPMGPWAHQRGRLIVHAVACSNLESLPTPS